MPLVNQKTAATRIAANNKPFALRPMTILSSVSGVMLFYGRIETRLFFRPFLGGHLLPFEGLNSHFVSAPCSRKLEI